MSSARKKRGLLWGAAPVILMLTTGCTQTPPSTHPAQTAPPPSQPAASSPTHHDTAEAERPVIVAFGNSLTAGFGVLREEAYPERLEQKLRAAGYPHRVINAGISGETTTGGLRRLDAIVRHNPDIVILELGANDGLRGTALGLIQANLDHIIRQLQDAGSQVVLAGMRLPPNYGPFYTTGFAALYQELARRHHTAFIPFFLEGVTGRPGLIQIDGLHPTADGYRVIVERLWPTLLPLLEKVPR